MMKQMQGVILHPLRKARIERNLTQQMLADFTGLSAPTIKRAERGMPIRLDARARICEYLGKTSEELGLYHPGSLGVTRVPVHEVESIPHSVEVVYRPFSAPVLVHEMEPTLCIVEVAYREFCR